MPALTLSKMSLSELNVLYDFHCRLAGMTTEFINQPRCGSRAESFLKDCTDAAFQASDDIATEARSRVCQDSGDREIRLQLLLKHAVTLYNYAVAAELAGASPISA